MNYMYQPAGNQYQKSPEKTGHLTKMPNFYDKDYSAVRNDDETSASKRWNPFFGTLSSGSAVTVHPQSYQGIIQETETFAVEMVMSEEEEEKKGWRKVGGKWWVESQIMWAIAFPAILTGVTQFGIGSVTSAFVGHLGSVELAAVSIVQNVIEGFVFGLMLGMGSALETLCGQAVGAGEFNMLGIYLQRSWIITLVTALLITPVYIFASPLLKLFHQSKEISELAGKYSLWIIPQVFAYAANFPIQKFLQSQSRVWVMTEISMVVLAIHGILNWIVVTKMNHGLVGAAIVGNISWILLVLAHYVYVVAGFFPDAWTGFSFSALKSLAAFVKLSLSSAIMLCLELWYPTIITLMVGWLKDPEIAVDTISICLNVQLWILMITLGFNASVSIRVSNELGAGNAKAAKLTVMVHALTSTIIGILFSIVILVARNDFSKMFTAKPVLIKETAKLVYFPVVLIFLNSIQCVLHGVAVGAGWQAVVASITIVSYYVVGLPISALLGYKFKLGLRGIIIGLLVGCVLQMIGVLFLVGRTNWQKEALQAKERVKTWGGHADSEQTPSTQQQP